VRAHARGRVPHARILTRFCLTNKRIGFNPNCEFRLRNEAGVFEVFARNGIKAGDEACISYGESLTNAELSERYGFTLANNPNGEAPKEKKDRYADSNYV